MSTVYTCESCNSLLRIGAPLPAGKQLKCPSCAAIYTVPAVPEPAGVGAAAKPQAPPIDDISSTVPLNRMPNAPRPGASSAPGLIPKPAPLPPSSTGSAPKPVAKGSAPGTAPKPTADSAHGTAKPPAPKSPSASGGMPHVKVAAPKAPSAAGTAPPAKSPAAPPTPPASASKRPASDTHDGRSQLADLMGATAMVRLNCPACQLALKIPENTPGGTSIRCSRCQHKFKPPWADAPAAPPAAVSAPAAPAPAPYEPPAVEQSPADFAPETPASEPAASETAPSEAPVAEPKPKKKRNRRKQMLVATGLGGVFLVVGILGAWLWSTRDKGPIAADDWKAFTPPNGHCQITMPGDPVLQKPGVEPDGDLPRSVLYEVRRIDKDDARFTIAYVNLPPNALDLRSFDDIFKAERTALQRATKEGRLRNESNFNVSGHFGREFQVEGAKGRQVIQRMIWVEGMTFTRIYVLQATVPGGKSGTQNALTFLDSLKLPPKMERAAAK